MKPLVQNPLLGGGGLKKEIKKVNMVDILPILE
jgi:hypothetical protein